VAFSGVLYNKHKTCTTAVHNWLFLSKYKLPWIILAHEKKLMKEGMRVEGMQFTFNIVPNNWKEF